MVLSGSSRPNAMLQREAQKPPVWAARRLRCLICPRFPITRRWPAQHPDRLQLYSLPTPNGVKVSIMLEETGLPYEPHLVDFGKNEQRARNSCR